MRNTQTVSYALFLAFAGLMAATRSHHFDSLTHLPDASLAVFLLAGIALPWLAFPALLVVAGCADYAAFNYAHVSDWCFSPAYWFLIPTYAVLFYAGRFYANRINVSWQGLAQFATIAWAASSGAFIISNFTFYAFSDRYVELSLTQYTFNIAHYYLPYLFSALLYLIPAVLLYAGFAHRNESQHTTAT